MICVRPLNILVVELFGGVDAKFKWDISVKTRFVCGPFVGVLLNLDRVD